MDKVELKTASYSILDPPGYFKPDLQDLLLTDINAKELERIAKNMQVEYLGSAVFPGTFPAQGVITGQHFRLMIPLVVRRTSSKVVPAVNIVFLIDTGSHFTYICQEAMEALIGTESVVPERLSVQIHLENAIEVYLSPKSSHFADVNVLGMDFIMENRVFPQVDFKTKTFRFL